MHPFQRSVVARSLPSFGNMGLRVLLSICLPNPRERRSRFMYPTDRKTGCFLIVVACHILRDDG